MPPNFKFIFSKGKKIRFSVKELMPVFENVPVYTEK